MMLTKNELKAILENMRISIPANLEKELLEQYSNLETDDEGHLHVYTKQDICEQLEKKLRPYEEARRTRQLDQLGLRENICISEEFSFTKNICPIPGRTER